MPRSSKPSSEPISMPVTLAQDHRAIFPDIVTSRAQSRSAPKAPCCPGTRLVYNRINSTKTWWPLKTVVVLNLYPFIFERKKTVYWKALGRVDRGERTRSRLEEMLREIKNLCAGMKKRTLGREHCSTWKHELYHCDSFKCTCGNFAWYPKLYALFSWRNLHSALMQRLSSPWCTSAPSNHSPESTFPPT